MSEFMFGVKGKRVLIVLGELGQLNYYREVAARLRDRGMSVGFCCDRDDPGVTEAIREAAHELGAAFYKHGGDREAGDLDVRHRRAVNRRLWWYDLSKRRQAALDKKLLEIFLVYHAYRLQEARRILDEHRPHVVLTGEDGIASNFWMIRAARSRWTKVFILPYGMADSSYLVAKGIEEKNRLGDLIKVDSPEARYVRDVYPKWVKASKYGDVLYLPPLFIVAMEELGIRIRDPWCLQGGDSNAILIEGESTRARYLSEGVPKRKLKSVGSVYADVLHDVIFADSPARRAFETGTTIEPARRRLLVCIPPSDHGGWAGRAGFGSVAEYIRNLAAFLRTFPNLDLVWSVHPRILPSDREAVADLGITVSTNFVVTDIARSDIVVQSGSSLSRWAIAARKVVVNYDLYRFGVNDFPTTPSYLHTEEYATACDWIAELIHSSDRYADLVARSRAIAASIGEVDGRSVSRITSYLAPSLFRAA